MLLGDGASPLRRCEGCWCSGLLPHPLLPFHRQTGRLQTPGARWPLARVGGEKQSFVVHHSLVLPRRRRFVPNICWLDSAGSQRRADAPLIALEASVGFVGRLFYQQVSSILLQTGLLLVPVSLRHVCSCPR